jgi:hypothetical protein
VTEYVAMLTAEQSYTEANVPPDESLESYAEIN